MYPGNTGLGTLESLSLSLSLSLYVCVYVYVDVYVYLFMCMCVCVCIHTHTHTHTHIPWRCGPQHAFARRSSPAASAACRCPPPGHRIHLPGLGIGLFISTHIDLLLIVHGGLEDDDAGREVHTHTCIHLLIDPYIHIHIYMSTSTYR